MRRKYLILKNIEKYILKINLERHKKLVQVFKHLNNPKITFAYFAKNVGLSKLFWSHDKYPFLRTMAKLH